MVNVATQTDEMLAVGLPAGIVVDVDVETDIRLRQTFDTMEMQELVAGNRLSTYDEVAAAGDTSALLYPNEAEVVPFASPNNLNESNLMSQPETVAEPDR